MLNERLASYLSYFESLAVQPPNRWEGFYVTQREEAAFGLRFQIAFPCYALAAIALHPAAEPADRERCHSAMAALIERMLQRRVWAYWALQSEQRSLAPDPVVEDNAQYSGLLAMMIGAFEAAGGDRRFDEPFTLLWTSADRFVYTHSALAAALASQMRRSSIGGVASEPGRIYPAHMAHVCWGLALHDACHGGDLGAALSRWHEALTHKLVFGGPRLPGRGVFRAVYRPGLAALSGSTMADAWTLGVLAGLEPELARRLAPRFLPGVRRLPAEDSGRTPAYVPIAASHQDGEAAHPALATGFCLLLAVALGDDALAADLLAYADSRLEPAVEGGRRSYGAAPVAPFTTALFALGEAGGLGVLRSSEARPKLAASSHSAENLIDTH